MTRRTTASAILALAVHGFAVGTLIGYPTVETSVFAGVTLILVAAQMALTVIRYRNVTFELDKLRHPTTLPEAVGLYVDRMSALLGVRANDPAGQGDEEKDPQP